ncbi:acyltransferase [Pseudoduganella sp. SL102]|uniref:acyltransferase family protein n=1 Tax=Pseudoduganella sp. SL102 TaxID=2995154 RepID=UPI00248D39D9|nr:acyltransferase [Pseudoduganella sp. SL102]WBS04204.1 acyltransferase [Pseudoduganella sp. SL102]
MAQADRQNNFNLIRLILALCVILSHSPELTDGDNHREPLMCLFDTIPLGFAAVDAFFVLSGYLIVQSWDLAPSAKQFLRSRMLRIYPGFLVASVISALLVGPLGADAAAYFTAFDIGAFASGALLLQAPVVPPVFQGTPLPKVNLSMWTISYEFACYLLVLAAGLTGALRIRHFWLAITLAVLGALALSKVVHFDVGLLRLPSFFLTGGCFYIYRDKIRLDGRVAIAVTAAVIVCMFSWSASELALATGGCYALIYLAKKPSAFLNRFNALPDVSYGTYLYAWPIQKLLVWYFPGMSPWLVFAIAAPAALALGAASWFAIEKPALKFKRPAVPAVPHEADRAAA